jgi:hypothetical protein
MATTFKTLTSNDVTTTRTLLHEAIPITGSLVSGTYLDNGTTPNIKTYGHGIFSSVYDYPYLSSSANHIFDISAGLSSGSALSSSTTTQNSKKVNIYNQMAQVLVGHDTSGKIRRFDADGDLTGGTKFNECVFVNFSRLLTKDEVKKGSFQMEFGVTPNFTMDGTTMGNRIKITDVSGSNGYLTNSPAGDYGVLYATQSSDSEGRLLHVPTRNVACGLIYYQAGIVVLSSSILFGQANGGILINPTDHGTAGQAPLSGAIALSASLDKNTATPSNLDFNAVLTGSTLDIFAENIRNRIYNIQFNNTTELNSTIYFCRASHNDFNYSSNPTYLSGSKMRVKTTTQESPVSYITTIGLYSADNELLAVAKLSEPLKKTPETELTLRVRLDY